MVLEKTFERFNSYSLIGFIFTFFCFNFWCCFILYTLVCEYLCINCYSIKENYLLLIFLQIKMMNNDGITGGNYGQIDDQQMITPVDRENYIARL